MEIKYNPYRGSKEPIHEVTDAKLITHDNHLEIITNYTYTCSMGDETFEDFNKAATLIPKNLLTICRTWYYHMDYLDEMLPAVFLYYGEDGPIYVRCSTDKEADMIYLKLRNWMIGKKE